MRSEMCDLGLLVPDAGVLQFKSVSRPMEQHWLWEQDMQHAGEL